MAQKADARTVFSKWGSGRRAGLMKEFGAGTPHCAFLLLPQEMPLLRVHGPPPQWALEAQPRLLDVPPGRRASESGGQTSHQCLLWEANKETICRKFEIDFSKVKCGGNAI